MHLRASVPVPGLLRHFFRCFVPLSPLSFFPSRVAPPTSVLHSAASSAFFPSFSCLCPFPRVFFGFAVFVTLFFRLGVSPLHDRTPRLLPARPYLFLGVCCVFTCAPLRYLVELSFSLFACSPAPLLLGGPGLPAAVFFLASLSLRFLAVFSAVWGLGLLASPSLGRPDPPLLFSRYTPLPPPLFRACASFVPFLVLYPCFPTHAAPPSVFCSGCAPSRLLCPASRSSSSVLPVAGTCV